MDKKVDQIAIQGINSSHVDIYVWSRSSESAKYESYSIFAFAKRLNNKRFKYIGDTTAGKLITISVELQWFLLL